MSDCEEKIYSNDYVDFIISKDVLDVIDLSSDCIQRIDEEKDTYFYPRSFFRIFDFPADSYASVPKCYGLLDETALEVSGILKLQQQPALALKGQGVMIGFIDTGIDYRNPVFQYSDGTTRIYRIWDQTIRDGTKPEGIAYGSEYKTEQINAALRAENPLETVPSMDTNGHGTFVAGVACGSEDVEDNFIGAAPFSEIAVVKLKEAKTYLREFYFIPDSVPAYQENDIMMAVSYLEFAAGKGAGYAACDLHCTREATWETVARTDNWQLLSGYCIQKAEKMQCGGSRKRGECKTSFSWKNTAGHGVRIGGSLGGGKYAGFFH